MLFTRFTKALVGVAALGVVGAAPVAADTEIACDGANLVCFDPTTNTLVYQGSSGPDSMDIDLVGTSIHLRGYTGVKAGPGCHPSTSDPNVVFCDGYTGQTRLRVFGLLGGGADYFSTGFPVEGRVDGGDGDDAMFRRDRPGVFSSSLELSGGAGYDELNFLEFYTGVRVTLNGRSDDGAPGHTDNVRNDIEGFTGTGYADVFAGDGSGETFTTLRGHDTVYAAGGDDRISDSGGKDTLFGGPGADSIQVSGDGLDDHIHGDEGSDTIDSTDGYRSHVHCGEDSGGQDRDAVTADGVDVVDGDCEAVRRS